MKRLVGILSVCVLLAVSVWVYAAGDAGDPLASLSYLNDTYAKAADGKIEEKLDASDAALLERTESGGSVVELAADWMEVRLKQDDALVITPGSCALLLAGNAEITYDAGAVVDITDGTTISSGTAMICKHRYMAAEDTTVSFRVTGKTAVLDYQGSYAFTYSDKTDYNAMAALLKALHLFKGSFTGFGQGFDLEAAPTRLQAIIMFIRVLGEEEQALAWSGTTHFSDIEKSSQAEKYVGYAYEKGYTNGYTATQFKPAGAVNAWQYTEFILRAMGYSSAANTNLSDTLERAVTAGILTVGEAEMLRRDTFLRAELVYISYYALFSVLPDGMQTLSDVLMDKGVFTHEEWGAAVVSGGRL